MPPLLPGSRGKGARSAAVDRDAEEEVVVVEVTPAVEAAGDPEEDDDGAVDAI